MVYEKTMSNSNNANLTSEYYAANDVKHRVNSLSDDNIDTVDEQHAFDTIDMNEKEPSLWQKISSMPFFERYHQATCTKMYEVEELVDYYFHRRLAAFIAITISYLPFVITPNQITVFGLLLGWCSAICLYDSEFHTIFNWNPNTSLFVAGVFMFSWIVSDCADGQVARLCKRGTRTGRILDGVVDGLVLAPNMVVIGLLVTNRYSSLLLYFISIAAGLSLWVHALIYDKIKNVYMENSLPYSECDGETVESVREEWYQACAKSKWSLESVLLGIYVRYLSIQSVFISTEAKEAEEARRQILEQWTDVQRTKYMNKYSHIVRTASWMGISAHVTGLYIAYFCATFYWESLIAVQLYFIIILNAVLARTLTMYTKTGQMSLHEISPSN